MKKVLSIILSLIIIFGSFSALGFSVSAEEEISVANCDDVLERYVNLNTFTSYLSSNLLQCKESVDISSYNIPYSTNNWYAIYYYINYYMPEFYNISSNSCRYSNQKITALTFTYKSEYNTQQKFAPVYQKITASINEILNGIEGNNSLSDVQKALLVHDRVVAKTAYDYTNYKNNTLTTEDYTVVGLLLNHVGVCGGYANLYCYLMNRLRVDTLYISSSIINHGWNKIKINGKWYYVDCTWDDPVEDGVGYVKHTNFLRSAQGLKDTGHIRDGQVDWDDSANNTEYDDGYYWTNSYAEIQYVNNNFYYIDSSSNTLNVADSNNNSTTLCAIKDSYYASLSYYNNRLLFNSTTDLFQYNLNNGIKCKIYSPDTKRFGEDFLISGFKSENGVLYTYCYQNAYRHGCSIEERDNYLITCNYNDLSFEEQHNFVNNVCTNCAKKQYDYKIENGAATLLAYTGNYLDKTVNIPAKLGGYPVTEIADEAFCNNEDIKEVNMPDTITKIGKKAFSYCVLLEKINFPEGLKEIGAAAFERTSLNSFIVPDSVETIGNSALYNCNRLKSIYIGSGVRNIGSEAFEYCQNVQSVTVSPQNSVYDSRDNCNAIIKTAENELIFGFKPTIIPVTVSTIGWSAFYRSGIENITIPKSVNKIKIYAFTYNNISTVTYLGTQAEWANIEISDYNNTITDANIIYKPCSAHSYDNGVITKEPTCTVKGVKTYTCTVCGNTRTEDIASTGVHIYVNGYCKDCDAEDKNYTIPVISIPFNQSVSVYNGREYYAKFVPAKSGVIDIYSTGSRDTVGYIYDSEMNRLAYNDDNDNNTNFSMKRYVEAGKEYILKAYIYGEKSSGNFELTIEFEKTAHTHSYTSYNKQYPSCSTSGIIEYTCSLCGYSYTQTVPPTGEHVCGSNISKTATCSEKGIRTYYCYYCDYKYDEEIPLADHTYISGKCVFCQRTDSTYVMPVVSVPFTKTVQVFGKTSLYKAKYTPQKDGILTFYSQGDIDTVGYLYNSSMALLEESDDIKYELGAGDNDYNFKITYFLKAGTTYILACGCYNDNEVQDILIKAEFNEHVHSFKEKSKTAPTCTTQGYTTYVCDCGETKRDSYVNALGHDFKPVVTAPKANAVGYTQYKCSCGDLKKDASGKVLKDKYTAPTGKPSGLKCASRAATSEKFSWSKTSGVSGYQVQISTKDGKKWDKTYDAKTATSYTVKSLTAGSAYKVRVRFYIKATDGKNYYGAWATLTSPTLPAASSLTKLTPAKKAFTAQWKKVAVTGYQLQYATNAKFTKATTKTLKGAAKVKLTVNTNKGGTRYYVRVRTFKTIGGKNYYSTWSGAKAVTTKK